MHINNRFSTLAVNFETAFKFDKSKIENCDAVHFSNRPYATHS